MSDIFLKSQTRGRPRKNNAEKLPLISRQLFSEHCAVFYACCMVYVLEVFLKTKQEKRIGHSEGGFTIYQKCSSVYCFDSLHVDLKQWGYGNIITDHRAIYQFIRTANGCAPKFVFKELVSLFMLIHQFIISQRIQTLQQLQSCQNRALNLPQAELNRIFKYIRFTSQALKQLKLEKWGNEVNKKIIDLWRPFIKIITYTIFCVQNKIEQNKYLKPFFSDAENPEETIIGQLNLQQIVQQKEERITTPSLLGFTKISKSFEEISPERIKSIQSEKGIPIAQSVPIPSRRPITLITFPSSHKIEATVSPTKQLLAPNPSNSSQESENEAGLEFQQLTPSKKVKIE